MTSLARLVLSIDIGTSNICAMLYDLELFRPVHIISCGNDTVLQSSNADCHEQDPDKTAGLCWELIRKITRKLQSETVGSLCGICITGQMHGVLLVDENLKPVRPLVTWRDRRENSIVFRGKDSDIRERNGCDLNSGYGGLTLRRWVGEELVSEECVALNICGYIAALLTGVLTIDVTHAAGWGIYDVINGNWNPDLISRLGIPRTILPDVPASHGIIGTVKPVMARQLGLAPDIPVFMPLGDNQAGYLAATGMKRGRAVINLGTGGQISIPTDEFCNFPQLETRPLPFGGYIIVGASLCAGWAFAYLERFFRLVARDIFGINPPENAVFERISRIACDAPRGANGLFLDPRFMGDRNNTGIHGSIQNINTENFTPGNLAAACLEGMVRELYDLSKHVDCTQITEIVAIGNTVIRNPHIVSIIEDLFKTPCILSNLIEETACGAALAAGRLFAAKSV